MNDGAELKLPQESPSEMECNSIERSSKEYRPSDSELLRSHQITIQFLDRGCIVGIGCKSIAFESAESAMKEINEYVNSPWEAQKKWRAIVGS